MAMTASPCVFQIALASDPISSDAYQASYFATQASSLEVAVHAVLAAAILSVAFEPWCKYQLGT